VTGEGLVKEQQEADQSLEQFPSKEWLSRLGKRGDRKEINRGL